MQSFTHPQFRSSASISFARGGEGQNSRCRMWLSCDHGKARMSRNDSYLIFDHVQIKCSMKRIEIDSNSSNDFRDV